MKAMITVVGIVAVIMAIPSLAADMSTDKQKISYSIGYKVGKSLKAGQGDLDLDLDTVKQAITDVMTGAPLKMTEDQMKEAFAKLQAERNAKAQLGK